jgi:uncharacterized repeat protein (TIGR04138 family)
MAKKSQSQTKLTQPRELVEIVREIAVYPEEAYEFVQLGLQYTVERVGKSSREQEVRHVSGQELSVGLRQYAWERWGMLARSVLQRWNITSTMDFGKIVYALIEGGVLAKNDDDRLEDFRSVYDFRTLESDYQVDCWGKSTVSVTRAAATSPDEGAGGVVL